MFRIRFNEFDLISAECPTQAGRDGVPHLAVVQGDQPRPFMVAAKDGRGNVATVNGVAVWDLGCNDWAEDDGTPWQDLAAARSVIKEDPAPAQPAKKKAAKKRAAKKKAR